ncbi:HAMP domain-containing protein [Ectopseudomonas hydrolytica]|uniref:HAMP domain-containing protein n=1 Tax=Ectopseudomonas hydrolytica TaxID=2493633 RepID=UPI003C2BD0E4
MSGSLSSVSVLAILSPLGRLVERARNISNNPLSQSLYTGRTDEFGQIEFALRMMQAETGAIVGRIGDASNRLSEHTRGLLKDIESSNVLTVGRFRSRSMRLRRSCSLRWCRHSVVSE